MPTYVYECRTCEKTIEVEQRITADPLTDCDCGAKGSLRRLIQPTAMMFKGQGFHINDYAGKPKAEATAGHESDKSDRTDKSDKSDKSESHESDKPAPETTPVTKVPDSNSP